MVYVARNIGRWIIVSKVLDTKEGSHLLDRIPDKSFSNTVVERILRQWAYLAEGREYKRPVKIFENIYSST